MLPGYQTYDLMKSVDLGVNWKVIHKDVFSFGVEGKFLYTSAAIPGVGHAQLWQAFTNTSHVAFGIIETIQPF